LTTTTTTQVWIVQDGEVREDRLDPTVLGLPKASPEDLRGGDATYNADVCRRVLAGEPGPVRDVVLLNAAAALAVWEQSDGSLVERIQATMPRAADAIDSGKAAAILDRWVKAAS